MVRELLEAEGFEVIGEAADGESALVAAARLQPRQCCSTSSCPISMGSRSPLDWPLAAIRRRSS